MDRQAKDWNDTHITKSSKFRAGKLGKRMTEEIEEDVHYSAHNMLLRQSAEGKKSTLYPYGDDIQAVR
jgi:hypothetical protein